MDVVLLTCLTLIIGVLIVILTFFVRQSSNKRQGNDERRPVENEGANGQVRRAVGVRQVRRRLQGNVNVEEGQGRNRSDEEEDGREDGQKIELTEQKIGAKKRAKLEAKAEKKTQREALEREREERKKREELLLAEREKERKREEEEEAKRREAEKRAQEEKERRDHERYLKMKETFSVEEEGFEEGNPEDSENLLRQFIDYIKEKKVLPLEDLAAQFALKTGFVVDRIKELQSSGALTGVIDDRGKFIYISQEELNAVAKFVRQRGRVSIAELAENSNQLINLNYIFDGKLIESS